MHQDLVVPYPLQNLVCVCVSVCVNLVYLSYTHTDTHTHSLVGKNLLANVGDSRDGGSTPRLGRSSGVGSGNHSNILAWKILWPEDSGGVTKSQI